MTAKMPKTTSKKKNMGHHTTPEEVIADAKAIAVALLPSDINIMSPSSASSKSTLVGSWTRRSILGLLESTEDHGMWKHGYGVQKDILKKMALDLEEYFGLVHSLPMIRWVYEDLLEQAQKEACEDAKKTGEVPLADVIMMHAMKLVEMAADDKHLHEVTLSLFI